MRPHALPRLLLSALFAAALVAGVAGCGDDEDPEATGSGDTTSDTTASDPNPDYGGSTDGAAAEEGTIVAKDFQLSDLTVGPGEEIVLKNEDGTRHTATADGDEFNLEADGGATSDPGTAPDEPGSYEFHCEIHSSMTATLTVEG